MQITKLRVSHLETPMGYAMEKPVFSFVVEAASGIRQQAAQITVALDEEMTQIVCDSGMSEQVSSLGWTADMELAPCTRYYWQARCLGDDGELGTSPVSWFETGKREERWQADWICAPFDREIHPKFEKTFVLPQSVRKARLYLVGLGLYEAQIGGKPVTDEYLTPYCNDYANFIQYQTYDVTALLQQGENKLEVMLGNGWYRGRFGVPDNQGCLYGTELKLLAELRVTLTDGREVVIGTDESWQCCTGPVTFSNLYDGEYYDARLEQGHTSVPARKTDAPEGRLQERVSPPVKVMEYWTKQELLRTPAGELVVDFGQIMTGWVSFFCDLPRDGQVVLEFGELLQDGNFYRENLRTAQQQYRYISAGRPAQVRPHFTFYGFRYMRVQGLTEAQIREAKFTAWILYTKMDRLGTLETSHNKLNRLIENAWWGQRGNFLDVPTDCPQRDERLGWTGDAQIFCATACYHMDTPAFYGKYLYDMKLEQRKLDGSVPHVVPNVLRRHLEVYAPQEVQPMTWNGSTAWGEAATVIPWTLYQFYGDQHLLEKTYENMRMWVDFIHRKDVEECGNRRLWSCGFHYADWLALDNPDPESSFGGTDPFFVATALYHYSALLTAKAAAALGREEEHRHYAKLAEEVKAAFQKEYVTADGTLTVSTQTAYAMVLHLDLIQPQFRDIAVGALKKKLQARNMHLDTGFVGTPQLCFALSENGLAADAYTLLLHEDYPSWLYAVNMGATTVWERWNSIMPDGHVSGTGMNSMNHYAYGAVVEWMYRNMAGLNPVESAPGFKGARIAPLPDDRFDWVRCGYDSASGRYESGWYRENGHIRYEITVPFDCEAEFCLPQPCRALVNGQYHEELSQTGRCKLTKGHYMILA